MYYWAGEPYSKEDCECKCIHVKKLKEDLGFCENCMHRMDIVTPKQYTENLLSSISNYNKERVKKCVKRRYYVQAIDDIHIQIYDELKFLLIKKIKRLTQIPIDENDLRFKLIIIYILFYSLLPNSSNAASSTERTLGNIFNCLY